MKKLVVLCLVAVLVGGIVGPATVFAQDPEMWAPAGQATGFTFGGLGKVTHPYWDEVEKGFTDAVTNGGNTALFENPTKEDVARQVTVLESYVAQEVDGIVWGASDPTAYDKVVEDGLAIGIPIITFDSDAPNSGRLLYIGPDNLAAGRQAGERMAEILGGEGKVAIQVGSLTALNAKNRVQGFKDAIADTNIEIVVEDVDGEDAQVANAHSEAILASNPDLAGFYGAYAYNVPAAARACQAAGKQPGEVKIVGWDPLEDSMELIEQGWVDSVIDQHQYNQGYFAGMILTGMKVFGKDQMMELLGFDPTADPVDNIQYTPTYLITAETLPAFKEWHKTTFGE